MLSIREDEAELEVLQASEDRVCKEKPGSDDFEKKLEEARKRLGDASLDPIEERGSIRDSLLVDGVRPSLTKKKPEEAKKRFGGASLDPVEERGSIRDSLLVDGVRPSLSDQVRARSASSPQYQPSFSITETILEGNENLSNSASRARANTMSSLQSPTKQSPPESHHFLGFKDFRESLNAAKQRTSKTRSSGPVKKQNGTKPSNGAQSKAEFEKAKRDLLASHQQLSGEHGSRVRARSSSKGRMSFSGGALKKTFDPRRRASLVAGSSKGLVDETKFEYDIDSTTLTGQYEAVVTEAYRLANLPLASLLGSEVSRSVNKMHLWMPELPSYWDQFWMINTVVFVFSMIPGLFGFVSRPFPEHWEKIGTFTYDNETMNNYFMYGEDTTNNSAAEFGLYMSAGYQLHTPLLHPMPSTFWIHTTCACLSGVMLIFQITSGRTIRWKIEPELNSAHLTKAEDVHALLGYLSFPIWVAILITGGHAIELLHPTLQLPNKMEWCGVTSLVILTFVSAWKKWWILHRLCSWGLIYSAGASVVVCVCGNTMQNILNLSVYDTKAFNYFFAYATVLIGVVHDVIHELRKLSFEMETLEEIKHEQEEGECDLDVDRLRLFKSDEKVTLKPFLNHSRSLSQRRVSHMMHVRKRE